MLLDQLDLLLQEHELPKLFWYVKGFSDEKMLFSFHDADSDGSVCLSRRVSPKVIQAIGAAMGCRPRRIETRYDWEQDCKGG
jgi:hypothetical protein